MRVYYQDDPATLDPKPGLSPHDFLVVPSEAINRRRAMHMNIAVHRLKAHPKNAEIYGADDVSPEFVESVRRRGIMEPLAVREDGTIISGHRRWQAARLLKMETVPVQVVSYTDELDEREALLAFNRQREKTFSQRMAEAEELRAIEGERARARMSEAAKAQHQGHTALPVFEGQATLPDPQKGQARDKVAAAVDMRPRTYAKAEKVWQAAKADPVARELVEKLDRGQVTVSAAYKQVAQTEQKQAAVAAIEALPPVDGEYHCIVIDPPWAYGSRADDATHRARNPYPSMTVAEITAMEIPAARDCILWLWTTNAFLHDAYHILEAWGFTPKTALTWGKDRMGLGDWLRGQTEHCILAIRGRPVVTLTNQTTLLHGPLREHSRKPDEFYALVESLCHGRKLEMFARARRRGWDAHGAETEQFPREA